MTKDRIHSLNELVFVCQFYNAKKLPPPPASVVSAAAALPYGNVENNNNKTASARKYRVFVTPSCLSSTSSIGEEETHAPIATLSTATFDDEDDNDDDDDGYESNESGLYLTF